MGEHERICVCMGIWMGECMYVCMNEREREREREGELNNYHVWCTSILRDMLVQ